MTVQEKIQETLASVEQVREALLFLLEEPIPLPEGKRVDVYTQASPADAQATVSVALPWDELQAHVARLRERGLTPWVCGASVVVSEGVATVIFHATLE
jgi:hypothetical protein